MQRCRRGDRYTFPRRASIAPEVWYEDGAKDPPVRFLSLAYHIINVYPPLFLSRFIFPPLFFLVLNLLFLFHLPFSLCFSDKK